MDRLATLELKIVSGPKAGEIVTLSSGELVFGRTQGDVVTSWDRSTSSRHFKIEKNVDRFVLQDLGSTNGTFVNGNAVNTCQLNDADRIQIGDTFFSVHLLNAAGPERQFNGEESSGFFDPYANVVTAPKRKKTVETQAPAEVREADRVTDIRQVRLRIMSSAEQDTLYWLGPGQSLVFGRTPSSDVCMAFDASLSSRHFRLTCYPDRCEMEDLQSRGGTWLNGKRINQSTIFGGDRLRAGSTELVVEVECADGTLVRPDVDRIVSVPSIGEMQEFTGVQSVKANGLTSIRGKFPDALSIVDLFERLHQQMPLFVMLDFGRISLPLPETVDIESSQLFDWIPAVAAARTPLLVALDELPEWQAYVEEAWGLDGLVGLQSELSKQELLSNLHERLTESSHGPEAAQGITGICWPSVLASVLENDQQGFVDRFFEGLNLALFEVPGDGNDWRITGIDAKLSVPTMLAIQTEAPEPAATSETSPIEDID